MIAAPDRRPELYLTSVAGGVSRGAARSQATARRAAPRRRAPRARRAGRGGARAARGPLRAFTRRRRACRRTGRRCAIGRQPRGAQHDRSHPRPAGEVGQLVRECGQLPELQHLVHGHARGPEALGRRGGDCVRRRRDLLLAEIEAREHDGLAVKALGDVDARAPHGYDRDGSGRPQLPRDRSPEIPRSFTLPPRRALTSTHRRRERPARSFFLEDAAWRKCPAEHQQIASCASTWTTTTPSGRTVRPAAAHPSRPSPAAG